MKTATTFAAVAISGWFVSCTPYPDQAPPTPPTDVAENRGAEVKKDKPATEEMREAAGGALPEDGGALKEKVEEQRISETVEDPKPTKPEPKAAVPVARRVPGRDGFVFSPYNNKMINVKDFASGTMVADPTYPPAEKKYFRVP